MSRAVERLLRLSTDVRPGEGRLALLMFVNVFLILCAYYLLKPLREGWLAISDIAGLSKLELKAYTSFGQTLLLAGIATYETGLLASSKASNRHKALAQIRTSSLIGCVF